MNVMVQNIHSSIYSNCTVLKNSLNEYVSGHSYRPFKESFKDTKDSYSF